MSIVDEDKEVKDYNIAAFKNQAADKIKELGHQLKMYIVATAYHLDDSKTMKEHKEPWAAKEKIEEAIELAISGVSS